MIASTCIEPQHFSSQTKDNCRPQSIATLAHLLDCDEGPHQPLQGLHGPQARVSYLAGDELSARGDAIQLRGLHGRRGGGREQAEVEQNMARSLR